MITEQAKERCRILAFWEKHGTEATEEAFKVKERTLFNWQKALEEGHGKLEALNKKSTAPKTKRKRLWDDRIIAEIKRLRWEHPNLGKEKLHPLLAVYCKKLGLKCPKTKTIGRLIIDLGGLRMFPQKVSHFGKIKKVNRVKVTRKPKDFKALYPGHCVAFDSIEKHIHGSRRYVITFEDIYTRFSFAWSTTSHASQAAKEFFELCLKIFPFPFVFVLTDNGSEFKKHFDAEIRRLHMIHYHTYPRTPKMNAHLERFNRTIQDEFIDFHMNDLLTPQIFNRKLMEYLAFYNTERVHWAFGNKQSPVQFMLSLSANQLPKDCKSGWPHTKTCFCLSHSLSYTHIPCGQWGSSQDGIIG
jgi:transposase InsO family protein